MKKIIISLLFFGVVFGEAYKDSNGSLHLDDNLGNNLVIYRDGIVEYNNNILGNCNNEISKVTSKIVFNCDSINDITLVDSQSQFIIDGSSITIHSNENIEQYEIGSLSTRNQRELSYETVEKDLKIERKGDDLEVKLNTDILFDFDSAKVKPNAKLTLEKLAYAIKEKAKGYIVISGYTDNKGTDKYNLNLSENRANSVAAWLNQNQNINMRDMVIKGYGENFPVAPNLNEDGEDDPNGRALNRRVEIVIQTVKKDPSYLIRDLTEINEIAKDSIEAGREGLSIGIDGLNEGLDASGLRKNKEVKIDGNRVIVRDENSNVDVSNGGIYIEQKGQRRKVPQGSYGSLDVNEDSIEAGSVTANDKEISAGNVRITEDGISIGD